MHDLTMAGSDGWSPLTQNTPRFNNFCKCYIECNAADATTTDLFWKFNRVLLRRRLVFRKTRQKEGRANQNNRTNNRYKFKSGKALV